MKLYIKEDVIRPYVEVQVGMKWVDDEFYKQCNKIRGNKAWIETRWNSIDSDESIGKQSIYDIIRGDNCDILIDPEYKDEWYGKIYANSAINLDQFYPDYLGFVEEDLEADRPSDCIVITVQSGLNSDGFDVDIFKNDKKVFHNDYRYGYNASYDPKYAKYAEDDYNKAKKYGWDSSYYTLKPYVTDIVKDLMRKYNLDIDDIVLISGKNTFTGDPVNDKDVQRFNKKYLSDI